jgi:hypothetical protein
MDKRTYFPATESLSDHAVLVSVMTVDPVSYAACI